jgi:hypothetical protein
MGGIHKNTQGCDLPKSHLEAGKYIINVMNNGAQRSFTVIIK